MRSRSAAAGLALAVLGTGAVAGGEGSSTFEPKTVEFVLAFDHQTTSFRETAAFVLPATVMTFEITQGPPGGYSLSSANGTVAQFGRRTWRWSAPDKPGVYELRIEGPEKSFQGLAKKDAIELHVFVMTPAGRVRDGLLNGYKIGVYPEPRAKIPVYAPPPGFVEVTKQNQDTKVSPHFRLKQFLCKQGAPNDYPKYVVLDSRLPMKLETILGEVNAMGFDADTLHVMSGFRTPSYNHAIGDVPYSMHLWGRAADVYVDTRDRGVMDDLTGDDRVDLADSKFLYDAVERLLSRPGGQRIEGGMGFYPATPAHPPFVHVDVRGTKARWKG